MSIQFSDTTNKDGIIQQIEQTLGFADGYISGDTTRLRQWTGKVNLALDRAFHIIFSADGTWQFDDSNHTDYPIITTNLVLGQRDYSFTSDGSSNLILDIHKVLVADDNAVFREIFPVDVQSQYDTIAFTDGTNGQGVPQEYDKTATGIFLDPIPSYNETNGLKIYISREGSYFAYTDTTKKPGFAGLYHEYLVLHSCYNYARAHGHTNKEELKRDLLEMEKSMTEYYARRQRDVRNVFRTESIIAE